MGTRGLIGFVIDGQEKLGYSHWGSHYSDNGLVMLDFARRMNEGTVAKIKELQTVDGDSTPTPEQKVRLERWADMGVSTGTLDEWYVLLRNTQGDPDAILDAGFIVDDSAFANDSLFNEGSYIIDLDRMVYEVYEGFQKEPHDAGRFANRKRSEDSEYYPIKLIAEFPLGNLPSNDEFLEVCRAASRDEED